MVTGGPDDQPAFLDPERADSIGYINADAVPVFDTELIADDPSAPSPGIINRYREIARRSAHGQTNNQICAALGYTASRMSIILKDPFVQAEIARWRNAMFDGDAIERLKEAARDGADRIHAIILDPKAKESAVLDAAKFAIEKSHGKARQEVAVESTTFQGFVDLLRRIESSGQVLDVTPDAQGAGAQVELPAASQHDAWTTWLDQNL